MMKTKFMAGLTATIISLVLVIIAAILLTEMTEGRTGDRFLKIIAFATIGVWLALYGWFKPKVSATNPDQTQSGGDVKQEIKPRETKQDDRNSYR